MTKSILHGKEALDELKETDKNLGEFKPDLVINKIPKGELKLFKEMAHREFNGDYGIAMKFFVNYYVGDVKTKLILEEIQAIKEHIGMYDSADSAITMLDGSKLTTE